MTEDMFSDGTAQPEVPDFLADRATGLARMERFVSRAGRHYASQRNYDFGPDHRSNVSVLSPWIRHRLIGEEEVLRATLARHSASGAEKFVQEVFWRSYFKGWLEHRPSVWDAYQDDLSGALEQLDKDRDLTARYGDAVAGRTGIDAFDAWAQELVESGYLHNHARMWFASIWIFTLRLPWQLGADFFLRHLMDGDPASNTLSWRWVAGLHTKGKTYLARASNIAQFTDGRFDPKGLSSRAEALVEDVDHPKQPIRKADAMPQCDVVLLITEEDGLAEPLLPRDPVGVLALRATDGRSPLQIGAKADAFAQGAMEDAVRRVSGSHVACADSWAEPIIAACEAAGTREVVTAYAPTGPVATRLGAAHSGLSRAGITLHQVRREYDDLAWPHASKGFFALKKKIPEILRELGLAG